MPNRSLTKICDQIVALLSSKHSTSIIWNDEESDTESVDMATGEFDRIFTFEVAETNEQEENAVSHPGFQVLSYQSCTILRLIYPRWIHAIFRPMCHRLAIRVIPQPSLLAFYSGKLHKDFWLHLTSLLKFVPRFTTKSRLAGCPSSSYCKRQSFDISRPICSRSL